MRKEGGAAALAAEAKEEGSRRDRNACARPVITARAIAERPRRAGARDPEAPPWGRKMKWLVVAAALVSVPASAVAQAVPPCNDMMAMQTGWMGGVMDECCDEPTEDCSSG